MNISSYLGRRNTNFWSSIDVHTTVGLTRDRRTNSVDDTDAKCTTLQTVAECEDGVGCLTTLADEHTDIVTEDGRLPVKEVRSELDGHRDLREFLEDRARCDGGVVTRATSTEHDAATATDDVQVCAETAKRDTVLVEVDATTHGVDDGFGLLVDLLLHEVVKLALHDLRKLNLKRLDSAVLRLRSATLLVAAETVDVKLALSDMGDIVVLEVENALRVLDDGGSIRGNEELDRLREPILGHEGP